MLLCFVMLILNAGARELSDNEISRRMEFLKKSLMDDREVTKRWWYGWLAGYGTATIGQGAVYYSSNNEVTKQDMALGAATCLIGFAGQFVSPFHPAMFDAGFEKMPEISEIERMNKLMRLEKLLEDRTEMEINLRKWKAHIIPTAFNLTSGLVTWIGFHRTIWDGVVNFGLNCAITEAQIWSQPIRARREFKRYRKKFDSGGSIEQTRSDFRCDFTLSASGAGFRLVF